MNNIAIYWIVFTILALLSVTLITIGDKKDSIIELPGFICGGISGIMIVTAFMILSSSEYTQIKPISVGKVNGVIVAVFDFENNSTILTSTDTYIHSIPDSLICIENKQPFNYYNLEMENIQRIKKCK